MLLLVAACASMGTPDGGPYDEAPPVFLASQPSANATNPICSAILPVEPQFAVLFICKSFGI